MILYILTWNLSANIKTLGENYCVSLVKCVSFTLGLGVVSVLYTALCVKIVAGFLQDFHLPIKIKLTNRIRLTPIILILTILIKSHFHFQLSLLHLP